MGRNNFSDFWNKGVIRNEGDTIQVILIDEFPVVINRTRSNQIEMGRLSNRPMYFQCNFGATGKYKYILSPHSRTPLDAETTSRLPAGGDFPNHLYPPPFRHIKPRLPAVTGRQQPSMPTAGRSKILATKSLCFSSTISPPFWNLPAGIGPAGGSRPATSPRPVANFPSQTVGAATVLQLTLSQAYHKAAGYTTAEWQRRKLCRKTFPNPAAPGRGLWAFRPETP